MATAELHFFSADDPNGSTIFECSTDDEWVKQIKLNIQRDSLGSGEVNFARKVPIGLFSRNIVEPEVLVRVLIPAVHATKYYGGFFINPRQQQVVSKAEKGGEGFTFAGPGPKHYLTRTLLWSASFTGIESAVDKDSGVWTWPETAVAGRILNRLLLEDQDNPSGPYLPDLTQSFDETDDSNGDPWTLDISDGNDDFTLRIQQDYLKLLWQIEDASGITSQIYLGEVGDPHIRLDAFQSFGRDLTEDVTFIEGHNIRDDLDVEGSSYRKASHALVRGNEGLYELAIKPSWDPGELKKVMAVQYDSNSSTILDNAGVRALQRQDNGEKQIDLRIVTGFAAAQGRYFPGPDYAGSNGDFWVGDTVSLTTGQATPTELDYQDEPQVVTGIELELGEAVRDDNDERRARSFDVTINLNEERKSDHTPTDLAGNRGTVQAPPQVLKFCAATIAPTDEIFTATRLYPTGTTNAEAGAPSPAFSALWDEAAGTGRKMLSETAGIGSGTGSVTWSNTGTAQNDVRLLQYLWPLPATGTLEGWFRSFHMAKTRSGVGISESSQNMISQATVKVVSNDGSTIRGVAYAGHSLTSAGTNLKWPPNSTNTNSSPKSRATPPMSEWADPALGVVLTPVAWSSGDYLVVEVGVRNYGTAVTGATFYSNYDDAPDLAEIEDITTVGRTWFEIVTLEADPSGTAGVIRAGHPDLVGTSARVARCDHKHHVNRDTSPTPQDDVAAGYIVGTLWHVWDDLDNPTTLIASYVSAQDDTGAAVWILYGPNAHIHEDESPEEEPDTLRWEAVTNGEDVFVWEDDDLVHEYKDYA